jgi:predicted kinase
MIIIVFGLPGSGKSFFASQLARKLKAGYVNSDELRRELFTVRTYTEGEKMVVYEKMREKMNNALEHNFTLVLDGTFYKESIRDKFREEVADKNELRFIEVKASESLIRSRLKKPRLVSDADYEVYKKLKDQWEPMKEEHLVITSTNNNIEEMLSEAEGFLLHHDKK